MSLAGPYLVACLLLVVAGASKAWRPADTARALRVVVPALPQRGLPLAVRAMAGTEAALGAAAIAVPLTALVAGVAASYVAFTVVVAVVRLRGGPLASCGCFGTPDTPATWLHAVVNLLLAASAVAVAVDAPAGRPWGELAGQPLGGAPLVAVAAVGAWLAVAALGPAARLAGIRRELEGARR